MQRFRAAADTAWRVVLAIPGSYALAAVTTGMLARLLPGGALSASLTATMLSFAVCATCVVGIFAARSALRATVWMVVLGGLCAAGIVAVDSLRAVA
ncbi:hypothetical protein [Lysobacter sp. CA199]|uniref:hypothetical protein n=1 Tax=Lysobacter sp. CA199 TaxID=3455608 RepID=UPI003F8D8BC6